MVSGILYNVFGVVLAFLWDRDIILPFNHKDVPDTSMINDAHFADQALSYHNWFRAQYNADALTWNASMAAAAEIWASGCVFKHSQAGQNLVAGFPTVAHSIDAWGRERQYYDWSQPGFKGNTGHFTQLVWRDTAGTIFPDFEVWYVVCNYANAGNVVGDDPDTESYFVENVGQQVSGSSDMGIVSHFLSSSSRSGVERGGLIMAGSIKSAENLQARATSLAHYGREDISGLLAALAAKVF